MSAKPLVTLPPYVLTRITVERVERLSPSFVRVTFGGAGLDDFGTPERTLDQRIKLIFPAVSGLLPVIDGADPDWYRSWLALPEDERGSIRTYSIRDLDVEPAGTRLIVDFVLHLVPGFTGPASTWASEARPGDELIVAGPRRGRLDGGGIEWAPGEAETVLLAGDETAAPAIARILGELDPTARGCVFLEVPTGGDVLDMYAPEGIEVFWLPRDGADHGTLLIPAVLDYLGDAQAVTDTLDIEDVETADPLWETPQFSSLGESIEAQQNHADRYFWIAGESGVVTTLRRHLVRDLGIDRSQVAFMGYWRKGVAMRG